jgi:hypothetical protein
VRLYSLDTRDPEVDNAARRRERDERPQTLSQQRNAPLPKRVDEFPTLKDFYNTYDEFAVTNRDREEYRKFLSTLTPREQELLKSGMNFYVLEFKNVGGLVMPLILRVDYADGTSEEMRIPAEVWRYDNFNVSKLIITKKEIASVTLDPHLETADTDLSNNSFPRRPVKSRFQLYKERTRPNPMQREQQKQTPDAPRNP